MRRRFNQARVAFVETNQDADDSIEDASCGFARYTGPDRTIAIAHFNITSLADAALEVERTPSPQPAALEMQIIPNEHASSLMLLADLSAQRSSAADAHISPQLHHLPSDHPQPHARVNTPEIKQELVRQVSPAYAHLEIPLIMPSQAAHSSPIKSSRPPMSFMRGVPRPDLNGITSAQETEVLKKTAPARVSTHRIMDILNNDEEVPVSKLRETQSTMLESSTQSRRDGTSHHDVSMQNSAHRIDSISQREEPPVDQALMDALGGPSQQPYNPPSSPLASVQTWPRPSVGSLREPEESLRRRDPLQKIRELLDKKAREVSREPPDRAQSQYWRGPPFPRTTGSLGQGERSDVAGYDPQRPSTGLYDASPSTTSAYPTAARRESQDQGMQHWEHDRRMSGSQASQQLTASPYQTNTSQLYQGEHKRRVPTSPTHHSPYAPPAGSLPLPPKPPGPLPSGPINFRFAHYDPAPPRQSYPPPSPSYPPASHPLHGPPQPQYTPIFGGPPPYQGGYVPPPGSFQAPPPPSSLPPYPPLKIHQYGGQPILPANMAPPPQSGPPMTFVGQSAPSSAYSPPQGHLPSPHPYEQRPESQNERPPEPQSRPRRQYRSYHAPGTQFRSYQGPGETRRRGG